MLLDSSPASFVVWHVLLRLVHPRYLPTALIQLDLKTSILFTFQRATYTFALQNLRWQSPLATFILLRKILRGGPERIRTADPYIANVVL